MKLFLASIGMLFLTTGAVAFAGQVNETSIVGTWEAEIIDPTGEARAALGGIQAYIISVDVRSDGSITYREYHDQNRNSGILGTNDVPACPGDAQFISGKLILTIDCSAYSTVYTSEIDLSQATLEQLKSDVGARATVNTTLRPFPMVFQVKKIN